MLYWLVVWNSPGLKTSQISGGLVLPILSCFVSLRFAMDLGWDKHVDATNLFIPNWFATERGTKISVVVDCLTHTPELILAASVPDGQKIRLIGAIDGGVQGCRRMSVFGAVLDFPP